MIIHMKKEYLAILVVGILILTYVMDAVVVPLPDMFTTPYHFFIPENFATYPLTTTSIALKALALIMGLLVTLSALGIKKIATAITLLVASGLLQLYALQDVVSKSFLVPLEWSLALTLAGLALLIPMLYYFMASAFEKSPVQV